MSPSPIYLISGANRGIGLGFTTRILEIHPDAFVYAGVRDPSTATALRELEERYPDRIASVKCISGDVENNTALAKEIEACHGRIDTIIANAGIANTQPTVAEVDVQDLEEHFHVNVTGPVVLFQTMRALLQKSNTPRLVPISSGAGRHDRWLIKLPSGGVSYGASKAALNWVVRKIHFENEWLVAFPVSPGPVDTGMLRNSIETSDLFAQAFKDGREIPSVETVTTALLEIIDGSTREKEGGEFMHVDGKKVPW